MAIPFTRCLARSVCARRTGHMRSCRIESVPRVGELEIFTNDPTLERVHSCPSGENPDGQVDHKRSSIPYISPHSTQRPKDQRKKPDRSTREWGTHPRSSPAAVADRSPRSARPRSCARSACSGRHSPRAQRRRACRPKSASRPS